MNSKLLFVALLSTSLIGLKAQFANALDFDGSNDYVTAPVPSIFNSISGQNMTIEFKIKPAMFSTNRVFYAQTSTSNFVSVMLNSSGKVYFYASGIGIVTESTIPVNGWTHIAIVKTSSNTAQIYFDGVLQTTVSGGTTSTSSVNQLGIGAKPDGSQFFKGVVDEFRIWDNVRTNSEITANMNNELSLPQTGLVTYYKFNQGIANGANPNVTTLNDELSTGNGTLNNFALSGTTSNWVGSHLLEVTETLAGQKLNIVPNPVKHDLNLLGLKEKTNYVVTNSLGQKVSEGSLSKERNKVDVSQLKSGLYFMTLGDQQLKFIKE